MTLEERFWAKVGSLTDSGCWPWLGALNSEGYGTLGSNGRTLYAHRVSRELLGTPLTPGLEIDHLCRNRACVNPFHLEEVTPGVNRLRGVGAPAANARKSHCKNGHPFDRENTRIKKRTDRPGFERVCRACDRERVRCR